MRVLSSARPSPAFVLVAAAGASLMATPALACPQGSAIAGLVQQVSGPVSVERAGRSVGSPGIMEPVCEGDILIPGPNGSVTVRLESTRQSQTVRAPQRLTLPRRARPTTMMDNMISIVTDQMLPNLRRTTYQAASREGNPSRWADAGLADRSARIESRVRPLLLRWSGGGKPYRVEITAADGRVVFADRTDERQIRLSERAWPAGDYTVKVFSRDDEEPMLEGGFTAGNAPPLDAQPDAEGEWAGAEARAAAHALRVARIDPKVWSFEAMQILASAPVEGLDRDVIATTIAGLSDTAP